VLTNEIKYEKRYNEPRVKDFVRGKCRWQRFALLVLIYLGTSSDLVPRRSIRALWSRRLRSRRALSHRRLRRFGGTFSDLRVILSACTSRL